jgi:serine protease Do
MTQVSSVHMMNGHARWLNLVGVIGAVPASGIPYGDPMTNAHSSSVRRAGRAAFLALLLASTALGGLAFATPGHAAATSAATAGAPIVPAAPEARLPDFADLVTQVKPAVVSITTKMQADAETPDSPFPFMMPIPQERQHRMIEARGSGFIIDASGIVVTNNHVVKGAKSVTVTLDDGTELGAKIIGRDARTDLAVLKLEAGDRKFPFIQLGDSASVKPGEWVVAMGNPFGLGGTVTAGIVSATGRDIGAGPYDQFIQVDAPINQGNSGGPLFTQDGKVVGVNSAILSPSGGSVGIGFAIPANVVKSVVADLEKSGHVTRGYAGLEMQSIDPEMAKALHLTGPQGALVAGVEPDGPSAKAGVEPGDVIREVNGEAVTNPRELAMRVGSVKPGEHVTFAVMRDGKPLTIALTVAEMPREHQQAAAGEQGGHGKVGLALAPISPELREQLDLPKSAKGAVVSGVQPGSPAEQAGIQPGDVIVGVGSQKVASPEEAVRAIQAAGKGHDLALRILRDGHPVFVAVNLTPDADQG